MRGERAAATGAMGSRGQRNAGRGCARRTAHEHRGGKCRAAEHTRGLAVAILDTTLRRRRQLVRNAVARSVLAKASAVWSPDLYVRLAVAGDQLGPMIPVEIGCGDILEGDVGVENLERVGARQPHAKHGGLLGIDEDAIVSAVTVEVDRQRRFRRCHHVGQQQQAGASHPENPARRKCGVAHPYREYTRSKKHRRRESHRRGRPAHRGAGQAGYRFPGTSVICTRF